MIENHLYRFNNNFFSLSLLFFVCFVFFVGNSFSQTTEQIKYYSERIELGTEDVKRNALYDLRNFKTESASRIALPALKDSSEIIRATATHSVIYLPKDESAQYLLPLLKDISEFVRQETAYALGKTSNPNIVEDLEKLLEKEKKQSVKDAAVVSLGLIRNPVALKTLIKVLLRKPDKKELFFRRAAIRSIGQMMESINESDPILTTPHSFLPLEHKDIRLNFPTSKVYDAIWFKYFVTFMQNILLNKRESQDVRREAAFAIGAIGAVGTYRNPLPIQILKDNLDSEDYYLAEICKEALLRIQ